MVICQDQIWKLPQEKTQNKENSLSGSEAGKAQRSIKQCGRASAEHTLFLDDSGSACKNIDIYKI